MPCWFLHQSASACPSNPLCAQNLAYEARYTTMGTRTRNTKMPKPSSRIVSMKGSVIPRRARRERSHASDSSTAAASPSAPDHLLAAAAPSATPVAILHGRTMGEGARSGGRPNSAESDGVGDGGGLGVRRSIHLRSKTRKRNANTTNAVTKMSSIDILDCTKLRFSQASNSPATPPHRMLSNSLHARIARKVTDSVPATADEKRHPKLRLPNAASPPAMIHRPSGGWTVDVCSVGLSSLHCRYGKPASRQPSFA